MYEFKRSDGRVTYPLCFIWYYLSILSILSIYLCQVLPNTYLETAVFMYSFLNII